jgi:folate-binding protein YgfZ
LVAYDNTTSAPVAEALGAALIWGGCDPRIGAGTTRLLVKEHDSLKDTFNRIVGMEMPISHDLHSYDKFRYLNGLAEGTELAQRIPLECNFDYLRYVNFEKGCYIGQELTSRTKYMV